MNVTTSSIKDLRLTAEDDDHAVELLRGLQTASVEDADYHLSVAQWADELEQPDVAIREWSLALRDRPGDERTARKLAEAHLDAGHLEKAARCLRIVVKARPDDVSAWRNLIEVQRQLGLLERAEESRKQAAALTGDSAFRARPAPEQDDDDTVEAEPIDDAFLVLFQERFQGREGVYARQWVDPKGMTGYSPIREPLSLKAIRNHLNGNHTLGIYPLRMDNTVCFAAFDLDLAVGVIKSCAPGSPGWTQASRELTGYAEHLENRAAHMGLALHRADSGYKGLHLWAFFSEPVPARQARQMCKAIAQGVTVPQALRVEIFPKQSTIPIDGLGNLIKAPMGIHRKTGRRAWFVAAASDWSAQKGYLQHAQRISREQLMLCQDVAHDHALARIDEERLSEDLEPRNHLAHSAIEEPLYHPAHDDELQFLLSRCVTLRALELKVEQTGQLNHDEVRVLVHTIGHLATGPQAVNSMLSRCLETDPSLFLKSPLRGNPMGCAKIRARIPEVTSTVACDCTFAPQSGLYPTPLLHLSGRHSGPRLEQLQFQALLTDFLQARKEATRWARLVESLSAKIELWFEELGVEEVQTPMGVLRRRAENGAGPTVFELMV